MKKLLWIGDAACDSGFARATHYTLEALRQKYEITVLGLNYRGDPHDYPYKIYPAWAGGDMFGVGRIKDMLTKVRPAVVVIQNDPWNIPVYTKAIEQVKEVPRPTLIGAIAIDGKNQRGWALNDLDHCIFWTKFAQYEAVKGGYTKTSSIVPLGVDLGIYQPGDRHEALEWIGLPAEVEKGFIVGNVNRNQPRKRLDLTVRYFAEWIHSKGIDDAYLYLHVAPTGDMGYDLDQLAAYYGLHGKLIMADPGVFHGSSEETMAKTYRCFDVQVNTGVGEGWGLTAMEGMACGVPQILGDWSAFSEWAKTSARMVPCDPVCSLNKVNIIGGEIRGADFIQALDDLYRDQPKRDYYRAQGLRLVNRPDFRWENIAATFTNEVNAAVDKADG